MKRSKRGETTEPEQAPANDTRDEAAILIERLNSGDEYALDRLMDLFKPGLLEYAVKTLKDFGLAEEIVQDTFIAVTRGASQFEGRSSVKTWLFSIAHNKCCDQLRRRGSQSGIHVIAESDLSQDDQWALAAAHSPDLSPEEAMILRADFEDLRRAICELPPIYEQALVLRIGGRRYDEIAQICKIPIGTVKSRIHNALKIISVRNRSGVNENER